jgi:hypothetical protein
MVEVDVDIDDIIGEMDSDDLISELESRDDMPNSMIVDTSNIFELRKHLYEVMGMKPWHTKDMLIEEINRLFL